LCAAAESQTRFPAARPDCELFRIRCSASKWLVRPSPFLHGWLRGRGFSLNPRALKSSLPLGRAVRLQAAQYGHVLAERGGKIDLVILLLHENLPDLLGHGKLAERLALPNSLAVVNNGFILVIQIEFQHVARLLRDLHRLRRDARHLAEIIDLPRKDQGMLQLLMGVLLELIGDV